MKVEREVTFFRNGRNLAVRIPREFKVSGKTAMMREEGTCLIIEMKPKRTLLDLLDELEPLRPEDCWEPIEQLEHREVNL